MQASQGCSLCSFGGSSSPEVRCALDCYLAGRHNHVLLQIAWGCLSKSCRSLPCWEMHWIIPIALYSHCRVWVEGLSLLSPNIGNISMARELCFCHIWPKDKFPVCITFSRLSFKLQCSLEVSLLQKWIFFSFSLLLCNLTAHCSVGLYWPSLLRHQSQTWLNDWLVSWQSFFGL